ncbi:MAG: 30S ribosomal protein S13 [archaeon]|nr:30S ribosomal protein S13 [archaeon]MCP8305960.1 30S ribosomal protein S13 [archaeon]
MSEFKHIVRISGRSLDGTKKVAAALADIKGVGYNLANSIVSALKIDSRMRLGNLSDKQISEIQEYIKDPTKVGVPTFMLNHRKDPETGVDSHFIGSDLDLAIKMEIDRERALLSWRGVRHSLGLKVRGQRTRTCGRKGRAVGVRKRRL